MIQGKAFAGHPVDVATGVEFIAEHDIEIDGVAPLIFRRAYSTAFLDRPPSVMGHGWVHHFDARLVRNSTGFEFEGHNGERIQFDDIDNALENIGSILNAGNSMELRREGSNLVVYHWHGIEEPVQRYIFKPLGKDRFRFIARELPSGQGLIIDYDQQGRVATVRQNTEGRCLFFIYNQTGLLSELQLGVAIPAPEPKQSVARYVYDERKRLIAVYDALGNAHSYGYDDACRLIYERGRRGGEYHMKYDKSGRCIETVGSDGYQLRQFKYNEQARTTWVGDSHNNWTTYRYNANGQILFKTLPNGAIYVTEYDALGRITMEKGPLGATTSFEFDEQGNLAKKTHPNGAVQQFEHDEHHQLTKAIDPDGGIWQTRYERGALVERIDPAGRKTSFLRDERNNLIGAIAPSGNRIKICTDVAWTREDIEDSYGLISSSRLDLFLNPLEIRDAQGLTGRFVYDGLGRLVEVERPDNSRRRFDYDPQGSQVRFVDGRGNAWTAKYSSYGECQQQADPLGREHIFEIDTEGRVASIRNPKGEITSLEYDSVGNLIIMTHFDGSVERMQYDAVGLLVERSKPDGVKLQFQHDELGNLLSIKSNGRELRTTKYDACGEIIEARTSGGEVAIEYEVGGRIKAETQNGRRITYAYDEQGLLAHRDFAGSKTGPLTFEYDGRGRLISLRTENEGEQSFYYDAASRLTRRKIGAVREDFEYDRVGRVQQQHLSGIGTRTYQYNAEDALIEVVDSMRGRTRRYSYDAADQLMISIVEQHTCVKGATSKEHRYNYDANGNLIVRDQAEMSYAKGDRLEQLGRIEYQRDSNGNIISRREGAAETQYEWNALGELTKVIHPSGAETTFGYDAFGRRTSKEHDGNRTVYYWCGDDLLAEEKGEHLKEYAIFSSWPMSLWEDGKVRHIVTSHHGLPQELIDDHGQVMWKGEYDDWGRLIWESGKTSCDLRLQGQVYDDETGLHYNRYRYYSPELGQFISPDPSGLGGETNRFRYAPDTINWADPLGLRCGQTACTIGRQLRGQSFNTGRKRLESAGFGRPTRTETGRFVFEHPDGTKVYFDPAGTRALNKGQSPHWHVVDRTGQRRDSRGNPATGEATHIPSNSNRTRNRAGNTYRQD